MSRDGFVSSLAGGAGGKLVRGSTSNAANPDKEYINAPAGEATRVFMATVGVFDRQRKTKACSDYLIDRGYYIDLDHHARPLRNLYHPRFRSIV